MIADRFLSYRAGTRYVSSPQNGKIGSRLGFGCVDEDSEVFIRRNDLVKRAPQVFSSR